MPRPCRPSKTTCASTTPLTAAQFARADANSDCVVNQVDLDVVNDFLGVQPDSPRYEYAWDAENRLISVTPAALPALPVVGVYYRKAVFKYDYQGRRFERTLSDYNSATGQWDQVFERQRFVWGSTPAGNGWLMLREVVDTDTTQPPNGTFDVTRARNYAWGRDLSGHGGGSSGSASCGGGLGPVGCLTGAGGIGGLLAVYDNDLAGTGATTFQFAFMYDANGNVGQVNDYTQATAAAAMVAKYGYDAYGNVNSKSGTYADTNTFRFSTKFWDTETNLGYWGYRYYDAGLGRWISRDPIGERGGTNLYSASKNALSKLFAPLGLALSCEQMPNEIMNLSKSLQRDINDYRPEQGCGGQQIGPKKGGGVTKPGGHHQSLVDKQRHLRNLIDRYHDKCRNKGPYFGDSVPQDVWEQADRAIPLPVCKPTPSATEPVVEPTVDPIPELPPVRPPGLTWDQCVILFNRAMCASWVQIINDVNSTAGCAIERIQEAYRQSPIPPPPIPIPVPIGQPGPIWVP